MMKCKAADYNRSVDLFGVSEANNAPAGTRLAQRPWYYTKDQRTDHIDLYQKQ